MSISKYGFFKKIGVFNAYKLKNAYLYLVGVRGIPWYFVVDVLSPAGDPLRIASVQKTGRVRDLKTGQFFTPYPAHFRAFRRVRHTCKNALFYKSEMLKSRNKAFRLHRRSACRAHSRSTAIVAGSDRRQAPSPALRGLRSPA